MYIQEAFSIPIAKFKWSEHDVFKEKFLNWYKELGDKNTTSHGSPDLFQFRSSDDNKSLLDEAPADIISDFKDFLEIQYTNYYNYVLGWAGEGCNIIDCWVNDGAEGCYQDPHYHANSWVSGCYYLNFTKEHSPIEFHNPFWATPITPSFVGEVLRETPYNSHSFIPEIEEGELIMWPSNIVHGYKKSPGNRMTIAMNFLPKGLGQGKSTVYL